MARLRTGKSRGQRKRQLAARQRCVHYQRRRKEELTEGNMAG